METILYFSPHLDDVVLSCAGRIASEIADGKSVWVATLFTLGDSAGEGLYKKRRQEDKDALSSLGANMMHLGLVDAPYRNPFYRSFETIIFGFANSDRDYLQKIIVSMQSALNRVEPNHLLLPMAVGGHIDHRLCYEAGLHLTTCAATEFYEDRPYASVKHATELRLNQLIRKPISMTTLLLSAPDIRMEFGESFRNTRYVQSYCADPQEIEMSIQKHIEEICDDNEKLLDATSTCLEFCSSIAEKCVKSLACYQSQIQDLFGDIESLRANAFRNDEGLYEERYWRLTE